MSWSEGLGIVDIDKWDVPELVLPLGKIIEIDSDEFSKRLSAEIKTLNAKHEVSHD